MSDDDPIVASYDVFIAAKEQTSPAGTSNLSVPELLVLQYPSHRPQSRPYNAARSQKPTALRLKLETGLVEVEVPMITNQHYNAENGMRYRKALEESNTSSQGGTYGLAAGFNTFHGGVGLQAPDLRDIPAHIDHTAMEDELETQILGGKLVRPTIRDPVYMLGTFREDQLHLSHLDALVQVRPQLHHLDAQDELTQRRSAAAVAKTKGGEAGPPKLESKAIDIKLKDNNNDNRDRNLNTNSRLLRNIQNEQWKVYDWVDQADPTSHAKFSGKMYLEVCAGTGEGDVTATPIPKLKSAISNGEWLDKMSAPRETGHGKKGLLAKLRGRERERARRKKNEEEKLRKAHANTESSGAAAGGPGLLENGSEGSDSSHSGESDSDATGTRGRQVNDCKGKDVAMVDLAKDDGIEIKEEPFSSTAAASTAMPAVPDSLSATSAATTKAVPKKRGRPPRRSQMDVAIEIDD